MESNIISDTFLLEAANQVAPDNAVEGVATSRLTFETPNQSNDINTVCK